MVHLRACCTDVKKDMFSVLEIQPQKEKKRKKKKKRTNPQQIRQCYSCMFSVVVFFFFHTTEHTYYSPEMLDHQDK